MQKRPESGFLRTDSGALSEALCFPPNHGEEQRGSEVHANLLLPAIGATG
jgi:hypothetical protein